MKKTIFLTLIIAVLIGCKEIKEMPKWGAVPNEQYMEEETPLYSLVTAKISATIGAYTIPMPPVGNQGGEGSCNTFAAVYYTLSAEHKGTATYDNGVNVFSPEWVYDQVKISCSNGSSLIKVFDFLVNNGAVVWNTLPYVAGDCEVVVTPEQIAEAAKNKIASYYRVLSTDRATIRQLINSNHPLIFNFTADSTFYNIGNAIWSSYSTQLYGGHAITLCGYDDNRNAYRAVNQFGTAWGDSGYCWIDYSFFETQVCSSVWGIKLTDTIIPPPPPPILDIIAPVVSISSPADGYVIQRQTKNITISATATDNIAVVSMKIFIDGVEKTNCFSNSCSYAWNVKSASSGNHLIKVTATDKAGNLGSKTITVRK